MNSHPYSPNYNQYRPDFASPRRGHFRGRNYANTPPQWRSPSWGPRHVDHNSGMRNNFKAPRRNYSSPRNNSNSYQKHNSSFMSTPQSSRNSSFNSDSSGFIPLPFSSPEERFRSPYGRRGGNMSRGRRSHDRGSFHNKPDLPVEMYFKPSMVKNPWKQLEERASSSKRKDMQENKKEVES